jgi:glycosyltransferase involved in cell wall biosynthesis
LRSHHTDAVKLTHVRQRSGKPTEPGRNLRILRKHFDRVGESDVRALYYLGVEYGNVGDVGNAFRFMKRYVQLAGSFHVCPGWPDEKCLGELTIAQLYQDFGDDEQALLWSDQAKRTKSWSAPYWLAGRQFFALAMAGFEPEYNFRRACHQFQQGWDLNNAETVLFTNPQERPMVHLWWNQALAKLGHLEDAIQSCEDGLRSLPDQPELLANLKQYKTLLARQNIEREADYLVSAGALDEAQRKVIGYAAAGKLELQIVRQKVTAPFVPSPEFTKPPPGPPPFDVTVGPGKLDIVFFIGRGYEPWTPDSIAETGIGGSETMAWEMARRLAKMGHRVRFYGHPKPEELYSCYEGVLWLGEEDFCQGVCDVLISSRRPDAFDAQHNVTATARVLWVHDVHCGDALTFWRAQRIDRILALSEWHRGYLREVYPMIPADKFHVTRNGIDLKRFHDPSDRQTYTRNPHRAIYSSSPDRGLLTALECWPKVRESVPDAELHVFYGFDNWEKSEPDSQHLADVKRLLATTPGVVMHGRVNQRQLAIEMLKSGVWAYPTWFSETSCITAMEAQAAGLRIVTSPIAALNETVKLGVFVHGDWRSPEYMESWTSAVVRAMQKDDAPGNNRDDLMAVARREFCLDKLATDWDAWIRELHSEMQRDVVPKYREAS